MKLLKIFLILIIILAVGAGAIIATDYFSNGFDIGIFDTADLQENTYEVTESYSKLIVETMVVDIEMAPSDTEITQISPKNREGLGFEYVVENDTLRITQKDNRQCIYLISIRKFLYNFFGGMAADTEAAPCT